MGKRKSVISTKVSDNITVNLVPTTRKQYQVKIEPPRTVSVKMPKRYLWNENSEWRMEKVMFDWFTKSHQVKGKPFSNQNVSVIDGKRAMLVTLSKSGQKTLALAIFEKHEEWARNVVKQFSTACKAQLYKFRYETGDKFSFLGKPKTIKVIKGPSLAREFGDEIVIRVPKSSMKSRKAAVDALWVRALMHQQKKHATKYEKYIPKGVPFHYTWEYPSKRRGGFVYGTCWTQLKPFEYLAKPQNVKFYSINISPFCAMLPPEYIHMLYVHEIAHTRGHEHPTAHGTEFYDQMRKMWSKSVAIEANLDKVWNEVARDWNDKSVTRKWSGLAGRAIPQSQQCTPSLYDDVIIGGVQVGEEYTLE